MVHMYKQQRWMLLELSPVSSCAVQLSPCFHICMQKKKSHQRVSEHKGKKNMFLATTTTDMSLLLLFLFLRFHLGCRHKAKVTKAILKPSLNYQ